MSAPESSLNLLVISDLHFGELADHTHLGNNKDSEVDLELVVAPVIDALKASKLQVDCIIAPGDLTSKGHPIEFINSTKILKEFAHRLGVDSNNVLITFGNHDVDWRICQLKLHAESKKERNPDDGYEFIAGSVGGLLTNGYADLNGPIPGCGKKVIKNVEIYALNSGFNCYSEEVKHGKVSEEQMSWFQAELEASEHVGLRVLIIHHHLWDMPYPTQFHDISKAEPSPEIIELLGKHSITTVIHGHRHHPALKTLKHDNNPLPITYICAGSFGVGAAKRDHGELPNTLHHISLRKGEDGSSGGKITTFQSRIYGWELLDNRNAHLDPIQWFGHVATSHESEQALAEIEASATAAFNEKSHHVLPEREDLPMCLRVLRDSELNQLISNRAIELGYEPCPGYPSKFLIIKP
jgi:predicted phosphodiesterase